MKIRDALGWCSSLLLLLLLLCGTVNATDVGDIIAQNLKGSKILAVTAEPLTDEDSQVIIVETTAGERRFIVTKANFGKALLALQNPALAGTNPVTMNNQLMRMALNEPAVTPHNTQPAPIQQPAATPVHAPGIVAAMVTSSNQQASR
jgi:hypothetical protein